MQESPTVAKQPSKPRSWLRFSLRTLLLLTALIASWLGVQYNKAQKQRAAVAAIQRAGGSVDCIAAIFESDLIQSLYSLIGEEYRQQPVQVHLSATVIDEAMLIHLNNLPKDSDLFLVDLLDGTEDAPKLLSLLPNMHVTEYFSAECGSAIASRFLTDVPEQ